MRYLSVFILIIQWCQVGLSSSFLFGECILDKDPNKVSVTPLLCSKASISFSALSAEVYSDQPIYSLMKIYQGYHLLPWLSLHADGNVEFMSSNDVSEEGGEFKSVYLSVGHPVKSRWRVMLGKLDLPFGLNFNQASDLIRKLYKRSFFWKSAKSSVVFSYTDLVGTALELAWSDHIVDREGEGAVTGLSARFSSDISALGGTKLIMSYYKDDNRLRKFGFAALNATRIGVTTFEWLRYRDENHSGNYPFHQLIRFSGVTSFKNSSRWLFEYEDDLELYYLTQLGYDYRIVASFLMRFDLGYYRSRFGETNNHWMYGLGFRASL